MTKPGTLSPELVQIALENSDYVRALENVLEKAKTLFVKSTPMEWFDLKDAIEEAELLA